MTLYQLLHPAKRFANFYFLLVGGLQNLCDHGVPLAPRCGAELRVVADEAKLEAALACIAELFVTDQRNHRVRAVSKLMAVGACPDYARSARNGGGVHVHRKLMRSECAEAGAKKPDEKFL